MIKSYEGTLYYAGRHRRFCDLWSKADDFKTDMLNNPITASMTDFDFIELYYLLWARFGNDRIAPDDEFQFQCLVASEIMKKGYAWKQRLKIQQKLATMDLTDSALTEGTSMLYNHAENPSITPSTATTEELNYINSQTVNKIKRGKIEGYNALLAELRTDVTSEFIESFSKYFMTILDDVDLYYPIEDEEE